MIYSYLLKIALNNWGPVLGARVFLYRRMVTLGGSLYELHIDKGSKEIIDYFLPDLTYQLVACTLFQLISSCNFELKKILG